MTDDDWFPTAELRFELRSVPTTIQPVSMLQQKWRRDETDDGEWRDVPQVIEGAE